MTIASGVVASATNYEKKPVSSKTHRFFTTRLPAPSLTEKVCDGVALVS